MSIRPPSLPYRDIFSVFPTPESTARSDGALQTLAALTCSRGEPTATWLADGAILVVIPGALSIAVEAPAPFSGMADLAHTAGLGSQTPPGTVIDTATRLLTERADEITGLRASLAAQKEITESLRAKWLDAETRAL